MTLKTTFATLLLITILSGCMPAIQPPGAKQTEARLTDNLFVTNDGVNLPLRQWLPTGKPKAVIIALHGFNDYSNFFEMPGKYFSQQGIASFAYDQRGFGGAPKHGTWAGVSAYTDYLRVISHLIKRRYPGSPLYVLGESMGGAVAITALGQAPMPDVAGVILIAPALWARQTMPWYQTSLLAILAHTFPRMALTGESVRVKASDNTEMLRALGRDPLVIKKTRVEAIYGLTNLMDAAYNSAEKLNHNVLLLYGDNDEVIPKKPTHQFLQRLLRQTNINKTVGFYPDGYHMLLRDLKAEIPWRDIIAWIGQKNTLPSGADERAKTMLAVKD